MPVIAQCLHVKVYLYVNTDRGCINNSILYTGGSSFPTYLAHTSSHAMPPVQHYQSIQVKFNSKK